MPMHAASLTSSRRLQEILRFLEARGEYGATSFEIVEHCRVVAPGTYVSEINANFRRLGQERRVECRREGTTAAGRHVFRYRLVSADPVQRDLPGFSA